jgi:hypothetical protein
MLGRHRNPFEMEDKFEDLNVEGQSPFKEIILS